MSTQLLLITLITLAYVVGATPTSHWIARAFYGMDLRKEGSGNLGTTNTYRVLGWKAATPVILIDTLKGWAPTALFPAAIPDAASDWALAYGAAAVLGHVFSFWIGFSGGKGVATSGGVFLALAPWAVFIGLGVWLGSVLTTGYVSLGSVLAAVTLPIAVLMTPHGGGPSLQLFTVALAAFIVWAHRGNVQRLLRGDERRFRRRSKG